MSRENIEELQKDQNFIEIISRTDSGWTKDCYSRKELLKQLVGDYENTVTIWENGDPDKRVKAVYKLPYSGDFIIEDSLRLLYCPWIQTFYKQDCGDFSIGTYLGVSTIHGAKNSVCKLSPLSFLGKRSDFVNIVNDDEGILYVSLPPYPETIWTLDDAPNEYPEERVALQESNDSAPSDETEQQTIERRRDVRERVRNKIISNLEYNSQNLVKEELVYRLNRVVTEIILPSKINPYDEVNDKTKHTLFLLQDTYRYKYVVSDRPDMLSKYRETYYFQEPKTRDQIFYNMTQNRMEKREFNNFVDENGKEIKKCSYKITTFVDNSDFECVLQVKAGNYRATFEMMESDDKYVIQLLDDNILNDSGSLLTISKTFRDQLLNQFTREAILRSCALIHIISHPNFVENTNSYILSLIQLLSIGLNIQECFNYLPDIITDNAAIKLYNNVPVNDILGMFDDYYGVTKESIIVFFLEIATYDVITGQIIPKLHRNILPSVLNKKGYCALHLLLMNKNLDTIQLMALLTQLRDDYDMEFTVSKPHNLISSVLIFRHQSYQEELINFLLSNNVDPNNCSSGISNLHRACLLGDSVYSIVEKLIEKQASTSLYNTINYLEGTALEITMYLSELKIIPNSEQIVILLKTVSPPARSRFEVLQREYGQIFNNIFPETSLIKEASTPAELEFVKRLIDNLDATDNLFYIDDNNDSIMTALLDSNVVKNDLDEFKILFKKIYDYGYNGDIGIAGKSVLHQAIINKCSYDVIKFILTFNVPVDTKSEDNRTPLADCIKNGDDYINVLNLLLESPTLHINTKFNDDDGNETWAIKYAKTLMRITNTHNKVYRRILTSMVDESFISALINKTIALENWNETYNNKLFVIDNLQRNVIQSLLKAYPGEISSNERRKRLFRALLRTYLSYGGDVNYYDSNLTSILAYAVTHHHDIYIVEFIVDNGADVNSLTLSGYSVLDLAKLNDSSSDVIQLLIEHGARTNKVMNEVQQSRTPTRRRDNDERKDGSENITRRPPPVKRRR
jgi:ankyrin repeat protein